MTATSVGSRRPKTAATRRRQLPFSTSLVTDAEWEVLCEHFPPEPERGAFRPWISNRRVFDALVLCLRDGLPARRMKLYTGVSYWTLRRRMAAWERLDVFAGLWRTALTTYDGLHGLNLNELSIDGCITQAPNGGQNTGKSPVDRGKKGVKRSLAATLRAIPVSIVIDGANKPDYQLVAETLAACQRQLDFGSLKLRLDRGYDKPVIHAFVAGERIDLELPPPKSTGKGKKLGRRWGVEVSHRLLNRFRRVRQRQDTNTRTYLSYLELACALVTFRAASRAIHHTY